jgi:hypothetical protein
MCVAYVPWLFFLHTKRAEQWFLAVRFPRLWLLNQTSVSRGFGRLVFGFPAAISPWSRSAAQAVFLKYFHHQQIAVQIRD